MNKKLIVTPLATIGLAILTYITITLWVLSNSTGIENNDYLVEKYTNDIRGEKLKLERDPMLCVLADVRLQDMHDTGFNHDRLSERYYSIVDPTQYVKSGENLSRRDQSLRAALSSSEAKSRSVVIAWNQSKAHREGMLDPDHTHMCVRCDDEYCVQIFAQKVTQGTY